LSYSGKFKLITWLNDTSYKNGFLLISSLLHPKVKTKSNETEIFFKECKLKKGSFFIYLLVSFKKIQVLFFIKVQSYE